MSDFHFLHPWRLLGLALCLGLWFISTGRGSAWHRIMDKPLARALIINRTGGLWQVVPWIFACGVIALAGPTWQRQLPAALTPQSNVMILLQQDPAMNAQDLAPSRHQRMQSKITTLINRLPGARFGLVVYHHQAFLTTPLTQDPGFYSLFLNAQRPSLLPDSEGSGLQSAIALAQKNLPQSPRSLILVTDTLSAADADWLKNQTLPLQIWVPGTAAGGPLPQQYAQQGIDTRLNVERFSQLRDAGIPVTLATGDDDDLPVVLSHIQSSVTQQNSARHDLHWNNSGYLLAIPLLLLLLIWRRQLLLVLLIPSALLWSPHSDAAWLDAWIPPDIQGQHAYQRGDYRQAAQHFRDPLWQGIAWYQAGNLPAAISAFRQAPQTPETLVWTGNSYARQKQWQQALNSYDQALSLRPDWGLARQNRARIARIVMQLRQKERDIRQQQGEDMDEDPDKINHDLPKNQGKSQQQLRPVTGASPQLDQWYQNLEVSPAGLLENLYRNSAREPSP